MVFKILIHDLDENIENKLVQSNDVQIINAKRAYAVCRGCFGCWLHTPGYCIMKDKLHRIGADISCADEVVVISRCVYGGLNRKKQIYYRLVLWALVVYVLCIAILDYSGIWTCGSILDAVP